jgi:hypothetical protein
MRDRDLSPVTLISALTRTQTPNTMKIDQKSKQHVNEMKESQESKFGTSS